MKHSYLIQIDDDGTESAETLLKSKAQEMAEGLLTGAQNALENLDISPMDIEVTYLGAN